MLLVADDSAALREILTTFLEGEGFAVRSARHGGEVVDLLESGLRPELLLLDQRMPVLDGDGVIRWVRARRQYDGLPIVLLTGAQPARREPDEIQAVLIKPFDLNRLVDTVRALGSGPAPAPAAPPPPPQEQGSAGLSRRPAFVPRTAAAGGYRGHLRRWAGRTTMRVRRSPGRPATAGGRPA